MRVAPHVVGFQPDLDQQARHPLFALAGGCGQLVDDEGLAKDIADGHARIERGKGILEDELHVAPHGAQIAAAEIEHVLPVKADLAGARFDEAQDAAGRGGLAAAGFADQSQRFTPVDGKGHAVHGMHQRDLAREEPTLDGKTLGEVGDADQRLVHGAAPRWQAMRWPGAISRNSGSCSVQGPKA